MQYRNKETGEIVEAKTTTERLAYANNTNYELVAEKKPKNKNNKEKED